MKLPSYRNYVARIEYDVDDRLLFGHIAGIDDIVGFHSDSVSTLEKAFHEAVDDYIEVCLRAKTT